MQLAMLLQQMEPPMQCDSVNFFDDHQSVGPGLLVPRTEVLRWLYARSALEKRGAPFASWGVPGGWFRP